MQNYLVPVLFTFYIQGVLKLKKIIPAPKGYYKLKFVFSITFLLVLIFTQLFLLNFICYLLLWEKWNLLLKFLCSLK